MILGGIQAWVPDFIGTAETKKPQISRPGAFSCISGAPAPFEPGVKDPVFKGFFLLGVPKGYTRGYTALAAGMFLDRFTPAEKAVEVRCSTPDERYRHRDSRQCKGMVITTTPLMYQSKVADYLVPHF